MRFRATPMPGVVPIEPLDFKYARGWFMKGVQQQRFADELAEIGLPTPGPYFQDGDLQSLRGVLRSLHYQLPQPPQGDLDGARFPNKSAQSSNRNYQRSIARSGRDIGAHWHTGLAPWLAVKDATAPLLAAAEVLA